MIYRSVWISDMHLGTRDCLADNLLDFLRRHESEYLYLVGDIFDGWSLRRSWYWERAFNEIVHAIVHKSKRGTDVVYIPGNHDEFARDFVNTCVGDIMLLDRTIHETVDGRRFLVLHGDEFDDVIQHARWLAVLGSSAYQISLWMNRWVNVWRQKRGRPYWSLSAYLKYKSKRAMQFISRFESAVVTEARRHRVDGVICGHIHHAELRRIGSIEYANSGDWVESCTALVEHFDGRLEIIRYADVDRDTHGETMVTERNASMGDGSMIDILPPLAHTS